MKTDVLIVGSGCSGLFCALNIPADRDITIITKKTATENDSYLAQGGICMLNGDEDYKQYFEDTMRAGHYENDEKSVDIMIRSSNEVIEDLERYGARFTKDDNGDFIFTREGAHTSHRILFHKDITGKEITSKLLENVQNRKNIRLIENAEMLDIIEHNGRCVGAVVRYEDGRLTHIAADFTVLATGGIGGVYDKSTNYRHLTGDAIAIAIKHGIELKNVDYVQIHPTTFYSENEDERCFLISESVRGEGAYLYGADLKRFANELLPRDELTEKINEQMKKDKKGYVYLSMAPLGEEELNRHFPNIVQYCKEHGYDVTKDLIPVVPAQHYFMGGIKVDYDSRTNMEALYAVGETACNGVHGKNRLASNSLLESLVFSKRAALDIAAHSKDENTDIDEKEIGAYYDAGAYSDYEGLKAEYKRLVLEEIKKNG